ncbi:hypothetical protein ACM66B_005568 [Microbotryomycetes sp. NB124-2]
MPNRIIKASEYLVLSQAGSQGSSWRSREHLPLSCLAFGDKLNFDTPDLTVLKLHAVKYLEPRFIKNILKHCSALKQLSLRYSTWLLQDRSQFNQFAKPKNYAEFFDVVKCLADTHVRYLHLGVLPFKTESTGADKVAQNLQEVGRSTGVQIEYDIAFDMDNSINDVLYGTNRCCQQDLGGSPVANRLWRQRKQKEQSKKLPPEVKLAILKQLLDEASLTADNAIVAEQTFLSLCLTSRSWRDSAQVALYRRPLIGRQAEYWRIEQLLHTLVQYKSLASMVRELPHLGRWLLANHAEEPTLDRHHFPVVKAHQLAVDLIKSCVNLEHVGLPIRRMFLPLLSDLKTILPKTIKGVTWTCQGYYIKSTENWDSTHLKHIAACLNGRKLDVLRFEDMNYFIGPDDDENWGPDPQLDKVKLKAKFTTKRFEACNSSFNCNALLVALLRICAPTPTSLVFQHSVIDLGQPDEHAASHEHDRIQSSTNLMLNALMWCTAFGKLDSFTFDISHPIVINRSWVSLWVGNGRRRFVVNPSAKWSNIENPAGHNSISAQQYEQCTNGARSSQDVVDVNQRNFLSSFAFVSEMPFEAGRGPFVRPHLRRLVLMCCQGLEIQYVQTLFSFCPALEFVSFEDSVWRFSKRACQQFKDPHAREQPDVHPNRSDFVALIEGLKGSRMRQWHMGTFPVKAKQRQQSKIDQVFGDAGKRAGVKIDLTTCREVLTINGVEVEVESASEGERTTESESE